MFNLATPLSHQNKVSHVVPKVDFHIFPGGPLPLKFLFHKRGKDISLFSYFSSHYLLALFFFMKPEVSPQAWQNSNLWNNEFNLLRRPFLSVFPCLKHFFFSVFSLYFFHVLIIHFSIVNARVSCVFFILIFWIFVGVSLAKSRRGVYRASRFKDVEMPRSQEFLGRLLSVFL